MISVLMATHNGADTIDRTLDAMSRLEAPAGGWTLVLVNNASTDDTEALILKWRDRLPLDYLVEPRLGKSFALNTALDRAEGDFIVMTDDDVLPSPDWLREWRRVADSYPDLSVFGGAIVPEFDGPAPTWPMPAGSAMILYAATPPYEEGEIAPMNISGPNLAIRASVRDAGWRFGEMFMVGSDGLMGEDSDFIARLGAAGHRVGFAPTAAVRHIIHPRQKAWWWMQRRFFRNGRGLHMEDALKFEKSHGAPMPFPHWAVRRVLQEGLKLFGTALWLDRAGVFRHARQMAYDLGAISQAIRLRRARRASATR